MPPDLHQNEHPGPQICPQLGSLEKQCGGTQQGTPAKGSSKEDPPNQPIAKDLPAGASAKIRAKPVSDRRQSQLTAWTAAIEDRADVEAFLEILQMKDPALAKTARDDKWKIDTVEGAIVDPQWVLPTPPALTAPDQGSKKVEARDLLSQSPSRYPKVASRCR